MKKINLFLAMLLISASSFTEVKQINISGTITSAHDGLPIPGVNIIEKGSPRGTVSNVDGKYHIAVAGETAILVFSSVGYVTEEVLVEAKKTIDVVLKEDVGALQEVVVIGYAEQNKHSVTGSVAQVHGGRKAKRTQAKTELAPMAYEVMDEMELDMDVPLPDFNTEGYTTIHENEFLKATKNPLSTFSIDVDVASYANLRRFLNNGQKPPVDAVRIEEMINYFNYDYPQPKGDIPFSVNTEIAACPWSPQHKLVHIGLQGKIIPTDHLPASNLVFLIDVSGSMQDMNKLPLLKSAFKMLVDQMRAVDRVAIVVYAGAAGLVLPSTAGTEKEKL